MASTIEFKVSIKAKRLTRGVNRSNISANQLRIQASRSHSTNAQKLLALADIVDGKRVVDIARQNQVGVTTIYYWIRCLNQRGLEAFEPTVRSGRPCHLQTGNKNLAQDLAHQAKAADPLGAKKLRAISEVLLRTRCTDVAFDAQISRSTLSLWIKKFNEGGTSALLGTHKNKKNHSGRRVRLRIDITLQDIQTAAALVDKRSARRFKAIALIMQGCTMMKVAETLKVSKSTVSKWCVSFNQKGLDDLVCKWEKRRRRSQNARLGVMIKG